VAVKHKNLTAEQKEEANKKALDQEKKDKEKKDKKNEYKSTDIERLLREEKLANQKEFPFTKVHVEDSLFILDSKQAAKEKKYIVALECVFYQEDCHYMQLEQ
jgi:hypothetical protein